jgi:hypothetical protein
VITTCPKCHQLYEALESEAHQPSRSCPRCAVFLDAIALLAEIVRRGNASTRALAERLGHSVIRDARGIIARARAL